MDQKSVANELLAIYKDSDGSLDAFKFYFREEFGSKFNDAAAELIWSILSNHALDIYLSVRAFSGVIAKHLN